MIPTTNIIVTGSIKNPDIDALSKKNTVDISLTEQDVLLSELPVMANYISNTIYVHQTVSGSNDVAELYFTPLYVEKINYNQWLKTVDKIFREIEVVI